MAFHGSSHSDSPSSHSSSPSHSNSSAPHSSSPTHSNSHGNSPTIIQRFLNSSPTIIQGASFRTQFPEDCSEKDSMKILAMAANDVRRSLQLPSTATEVDLKSIPFKWNTTFVKDIYNHTNGSSYLRYNRGIMQMNMKIGSDHANSYTAGNGGKGAQNLVQDPNHISSDGTFWNDQEHPITKSAYSVHANGHNSNLILNTANLISQKSKNLSDELTDADAAFENKQDILNRINQKLLKAAGMPLEEERYVGHANHSNHASHASHSSHSSHSSHASHASHSSSHSSSSKKYKENIKPFMKSGLEILNNINIVSFNYNNKEPMKEDTSITHYGFIAEDTSPILSTHYQDRMDYTSCIGILIKAVQELAQKVEELEK